MRQGHDAGDSQDTQFLRAEGDLVHGAQEQGEERPS